MDVPAADVFPRTAPNGQGRQGNIASEQSTCSLRRAQTSHNGLHRDRHQNSGISLLAVWVVCQGLPCLYLTQPLPLTHVADRCSKIWAASSSKRGPQNILTRMFSNEDSKWIQMVSKCIKWCLIKVQSMATSAHWTCAELRSP